MTSPYQEGDYVVYPAHGVGRLIGFEKQSIDSQTIELMVVAFEKDRMILRIPIAKVESAGLRPLSSKQQMEEVLSTLTVKTKVRRTMWARRAQEYENKINSGDPMSLAEVLRELHRYNRQGEQSYSERQIYHAALEKLARELAAVEDIHQEEAVKRLEGQLKVA